MTTSTNATATGWAGPGFSATTPQGWIGPTRGWAGPTRGWVGPTRGWLGPTR
ncbi:MULTISPECIES: hypothetical protein [Micromonospora]|uniref:Uncharacterized protein n=1 Tax=Micromonospora humi TaxID=745366 RepID=A0A1C5HLX2_9ACTN|nr:MULTISPECIES: hypothetical protein [Micromonospora]MDG4799568.1 hypothetical protein [Micromonospora sp. WMMD980]SCG46968.1 hypothetical protein GA0070213_103299 [Micromonospora humi]